MNPFRLVPWNIDFLPKVRDVVDEMTDGKPGRAVVVFPHSRPRRYLTDIYRRSGRLPLLLPRMMTGQELMARCRAAWSGEQLSPRQASRLDQVALLRRAVDRAALSLGAGHPLSVIMQEEQGGDMTRFFPWGVRLAGLMEEGFNQLSSFRDIMYAGDQVEPFAAALLENLGLIRDLYLEELDAAALGSPGRDAAIAAQYAAEREAQGGKQGLPDFLQDRPLLLCGFVRLTKAENAVFHYLWRQGATVLLHSDPALLEGRGHWSCQDHAEWIQKWGAGCELLGEVSLRKPKLHFYAGYDLHSQLEEMQRCVGSDPSPTDEGAGGQAVVLTSSDLLMPALHHLPAKNVNISLGYPLDRSLLARLLESIFKVLESRRPDGRVYWRPLLNLISHPYIRMLREEPAEGQERGATARSLLHIMERELRRGGQRYVHPSEFLDEILDSLLGDLDGDQRRWSKAERESVSEADAALLEKCFQVLIEEWAEVDSLRRMSGQMGALCEILLQCGGSVWDVFPIDAECLARLLQSLLPGLEDNCLADEILPLSTLLAIVRQALAEERVPFEADPLTGLQVLGMLETRLLRFERVVLLDLTEDKLPGSPRQDPLLPDSLRGLLGLPDTHERDRLAAHTFQRLLAGAGEVHLLWQEGVEQSGLLDSKKVRSRFVEEALWELEKTRGARLKPGQGPFRSAVFPLSSPPVRTRRPIENSPEIAARMEELLRSPLSPSLLDSYVRCPAAFFYSRLCQVKAPDEVPEGDDYQGVGTMLHSVLRQGYAPHVGRALDGEHPAAEELEAAFFSELDERDLRNSLPPESWFMFRETGPRALWEYQARQVEGAVPLLLELQMEATLEVEGSLRKLSGTLDRVDRRNGGEVVLDYKSGKIRSIDPGLWSDEAFWARLRDWQPPQGKGALSPDPVLLELRDRVPSLQLPCYLLLYYLQSGKLPVNAVWVALNKKGEETPLFPENLEAEEAEILIKQRIPALVEFVLRHMAHSAALVPCEGDHCVYCPYQGVC